jgi:hypothetical protein
MEHKSAEQLLDIADLKTGPQPLSRRERLERWAEMLEREPEASLQTLGEIEWQAEAARPLMRANNSPLTVAYSDPVLRGAGLTSDRLGDAMQFFELNAREVHEALCSCRYGGTIRAGVAARVIRAIAHGRLSYVSPLAVWSVMALPAVCFAGYVLTRVV